MHFSARARHSRAQCRARASFRLSELNYLSNQCARAAARTCVITLSRGVRVRSDEFVDKSKAHVRGAPAARRPAWSGVTVRRLRAPEQFRAGVAARVLPPASMAASSHYSEVGSASGEPSGTLRSRGSPSLGPAAACQRAARRCAPAWCRSTFGASERRRCSRRRKGCPPAP